jgi:hypothetical protein
MRHFRRWEIADIGVLVHRRLGDHGRRSKVALLQSKRLYPVGAPVREETVVDYEIGLARLADPEDEAISIGFATEFRFTDDSAYGQIREGSNQVSAIEDYEKEIRLKVYYQLYNPWSSRSSNASRCPTTSSRRASPNWACAWCRRVCCTRALRERHIRRRS